MPKYSKILLCPALTIHRVDSGPGRKSLEDEELALLSYLAGPEFLRALVVSIATGKRVLRSRDHRRFPSKMNDAASIEF